MEAVRAVRRGSNSNCASVDAGALRLVSDHFSRIGKAKSASGAAYQTMTQAIIPAGAAGVPHALAACKAHARKRREQDLQHPLAWAAALADALL